MSEDAKQQKVSGAAQPGASWDEFMAKVVEAVNECPSPEKHCGRSAIRHIQKAWAIKATDPEMAAFRSITAEEEVATAIFHALVRRKYVGARRIDPRSHVHKAAVAPFFDAVDGFFAEVQNKHKFTFSLAWGNGKDRRLHTMLRTTFAPGGFFPEPPLHFTASLSGVPYDFGRELAAVASAKGAKSILDAIQTRANLRNRVLYASSQGIPSVTTPLDGFLERTKGRVYAHLVVLLLIDQYREKQDFVQQALNAFLKILPRLKPAVPFK